MLHHVGCQLATVALNIKTVSLSLPKGGFAWEEVVTQPGTSEEEEERLDRVARVWWDLLPPWLYIGWDVNNNNNNNNAL